MRPLPDPKFQAPLLLRTVLLPPPEGGEAQPVSISLLLPESVAPGDASCALQFDGLFDAPLCYAGIDLMQALETALGAADSHLVYLSRARPVLHGWQAPYHSTSGWGARPAPPAPSQQDAFAHTYWLLDPAGEGRFARLLVEAPVRQDSVVGAPPTWACHLALHPWYGSWPPVVAADPLSALNMALQLGSMLLDAFRRQGWTICESIESKQVLPAPQMLPGEAATRGIVDGIRQSHVELFALLTGSEHLPQIWAD